MLDTIVITNSGKLYTTYEIFNPYTFRLIEDEYGRAASRVIFHYITVEQIAAIL